MRTLLAITRRDAVVVGDDAFNRTDGDLPEECCETRDGNGDPY